MPRPLPWRALTLALAAILAIAPAACRGGNGGAPRVIVIGGEPKVRDPAAGPLSAPDAAMLGGVAQGLVRFDASGNIVPGLAERWNVSDDGLSYIFRIASTNWSNGRKVTAQQVARVLKRSIAPASANPLRDTLGAVEDVVAMTDRVIEIRLRAPRPNLLALLAQPEFAILRNGAGTGPFKVAAERGPGGELRLTREVLGADDEATRRDEVLLSGAAPRSALSSFVGGKADLVLGGTFADLPIAQSAKLPRGSLRFDPAMGLFGLVPVRANGELEDADFRRFLSRAINRDALIAAMRVPGLGPRATVLEPALDGVPDPTAPAWLGIPLEQRHAALVAEATRLFGSDKPVIRIFLPDGPGSDMLLNRLTADWGVLGISVERARALASADLKLVDLVAPSTSPAWFLRQFRCGVAPVCDAQADKLLDAARDALIPAQRGALLAQAAGRIDQAQLFIPLTAPVRWSLVSNRVPGFAGNRYARHTLTDLDQRPGSGG
jgi:peptide/nickel transport system substrate-binding protein